MHDGADVERPAQQAENVVFLAQRTELAAGAPRFALLRKATPSTMRRTLGAPVVDYFGGTAARSEGARQVSSDPIGEVIQAMDAVRAELPRHDGIGVFIDVYRRVTEQVRLRVADGTFADPRFVEHLDVVFARIFLEVPQSVAAGQSVDQSLAAAGGQPWPG